MDGLKLVRKILPLFGIVILIIFLSSLDWTNLRFEVVTKTSLTLVFVLIGITIINILLKAWRWKLLVRNVTAQTISVPFSFISIIAGVAAGSFIPGKVEMAKPLLLKAEKNIPFSQSLSTLFIERIFDFLIIVTFLLLSIALLPQQKVVGTTLLFLFSAGVIIMLIGVIFFPQLVTNSAKKIIRFCLPGHWCEKAALFCEQFFQSFAIFKQKWQVFVLFIISFIANGLEIYRLKYLLAFFSVDATFMGVSFAFAVAVAVGILSLIPGGVGITELTIAGVLGLLLPSAASSAIKGAVIIERIFAYYLLIIVGAVILIFYKKTLQKASTEQEST